MAKIEPNTVYARDCVKGMKAMEAESVHLVFADPPFNIGYKYDVYDDERAAGDYLKWCGDWIQQVSRVLRDDGAFWLAIGDEFAAELKLLAQKEAGFHCRSWVIWYYTFGVNCKRSFSRSHTHLLYFVKNARRFTFNADDPEVRVPSARQLVYGDGRANPLGRLPDNTWILRPQDAPEGGFAAGHDTWYFPRVAGTFKEREGFHGCQMPEQLLGRIIRTCSRPDEIVLDPFGGSGTTLAVAKKLQRQWLGFDMSKEYVRHMNTRLAKITPGDPLDGVADPLASAPKTKEGRRLDQVVSGKNERERAARSKSERAAARLDRASQKPKSSRKDQRPLFPLG
ncbi:MAG: site-specific DNA-methyltransferase [Planctomycetota bacterium]|nr:site-specific DNA-methyltransferase [Planctomycetota bacterium]